jgi:hypothetical protein
MARLFLGAHVVFWLGWVVLAWAAAPPRSFMEGTVATSLSAAIMAFIYWGNTTVARVASRWLKRDR